MIPLLLLAIQFTGGDLVKATTPGKHAGILFVHWYEPKSADSNRTQFRKQADELAAKGATSLLVDTMWSDPKWFQARDRTKDYENSLKQLDSLQKALDYLLSQPDVDPKRIAYVGHDFGMMYGALLAGRDNRVKVWALQAGSGHFPDWFLYGPKMEEPARSQFIEKFKPIDPINFVGKLNPLLLQFGTNDFYVPAEKREELLKAAPQATNGRLALSYDFVPEEPIEGGFLCWATGVSRKPFSASFRNQSSKASCCRERRRLATKFGNSLCTVDGSRGSLLLT